MSRQKQFSVVALLLVALCGTNAAPPIAVTSSRAEASNPKEPIPSPRHLADQFRAPPLEGRSEAPPIDAFNNPFPPSPSVYRDYYGVGQGQGQDPVLRQFPLFNVSHALALIPTSINGLLSPVNTWWQGLFIPNPPRRPSLKTYPPLNGPVYASPYQQMEGQNFPLNVNDLIMNQFLVSQLHQSANNVYPQPQLYLNPQTHNYAHAYGIHPKLLPLPHPQLYANDPFPFPVPMIAKQPLISSSPYLNP